MLSLDQEPGTICVFNLLKYFFFQILLIFFLFLLFHLIGPRINQVIGLNTNRSSAHTRAVRPAFRENLILMPICALTQVLLFIFKKYTT